jgi:hypothetical protein
MAAVVTSATVPAALNLVLASLFSTPPASAAPAGVGNLPIFAVTVAGDVPGLAAPPAGWVVLPVVEGGGEGLWLVEVRDWVLTGRVAEDDSKG